MNLFTRVVMAHSGQPEIAKVNRKTGVLFLNSKIWDQLPTDQKDFVLFHEEGHLRLNTADEFAANQYAVQNFTPSGRFTNNELGKRIIVMREILGKADKDYSAFTEIINEAGTQVQGVMQKLAVLGIGSRGRASEATAAAEASAISSKANTKVFIIAGILVILAIVIFLTLRKT